MQGFIDESKARGLVVACTVADPRALNDSRKALHALRANGQRRIHFTKESDPRRRKICSTICELELTVAVYDTTSIRDARRSRQAALDAVVLDLSRLAATRLTIEQDDSLIAADRAYLYSAVRRHGIPDLAYYHCRPQEEPLLWVSDAVVWCYAKGGEWRRRVEPIIGSITTVRA
ncbi:hypothetical protein ACLTEW_23060 [Gordonia lacunae]|uniref:hypothetical protein n=1 Tax=Gordonia lacunae TaxID=417102 RepID=UPI0039E4D8B7